MRWIEPVVSVLGVTSLASSTPSVSKTSLLTPITISPIGTTKVRPSDTGGGAPGGVPATKLGINLTGITYYANTRAFMNLAAGGGWSLVQKGGAWVAMPGDRLDANRNVIDLQSGEQAAKQFSVPTAAYRGTSVDIICRWEGTGTVKMFGQMVKNLKYSGKSLTFTFVPQGTSSGSVLISNVSSSDPIRNIDCRERDADPNALFDPTFLTEVKRYSTIRFMKWTRSVESNIAVTWANRTKPGDGVINGSDSVPIEYMVELANQTQTNPWFNIPWNADDDYVRNTAIYVRDHLDKNLKAYVETSNEVWNYQYAVTSQAVTEGKAKALPGGDDFSKLLRRYAQRTGEVMDVWTSVYAGQSSRLVRVAATQNSAWAAGQILGFQDTAKKVDALATAPYFAATLKAGRLAEPGVMDAFFSNMLVGVDDRIKEAKACKDVATQYGLRYITYEAGQHLVSPDDLPQLVRAERDPRMGNLYTRYLTGWRDQIGDLTVLFADYGGVSKYGAWGNQEYPGQPLSEAPKANAIELFRKSYVR